MDTNQTQPQWRQRRCSQVPCDTECTIPHPSPCSQKGRQDQAGQEKTPFLLPVSSALVNGCHHHPISQTKTLIIVGLLSYCLSHLQTTNFCVDFTSEWSFKLASWLHLHRSYLSQGPPCSVRTLCSVYPHSPFSSELDTLKTNPVTIPTQLCAIMFRSSKWMTVFFHLKFKNPKFFFHHLSEINRLFSDYKMLRVHYFLKRE